jgi:AcrR family transcriptional regulator
MDLPLVNQPPPERADAARNRRKVLVAADALFRERGVAEVSMDDVAAAAGVGKGTLYRRFGDKSGLAAALLDDRESVLQANLLSGPPPLGPGAPPSDRLVAFAVAYLRYVDGHLDLVAMSQTASPGARLRIGAHLLWTQHCRRLLTEAGAPDPQVRADTLLAALSAEQVRYWRREQRRSLANLTAAITRLCQTLTR